MARGLIANTQKEYKRLGSVVNDGRLAGLIDWNSIVDRTREMVANSHWDDPSDIIRSAASSFALDKWVGQEYRPEVYIEKEALAGVFEGVCQELDIPYLCCRGYTSQSEMWSSAMRLQRHRKNGQTPVIFHFGDHDPSGIDMTRDIDDRLSLFMGGLKVDRLALNMDQVTTFNPPPNPAKLSDSRAEVYIARFGDESWELDALSPTVLAGLVRDAVAGIIDQAMWDARKEEEDEGRRLLELVSEKWDELTEDL